MLLRHPVTISFGLLLVVLSSSAQTNHTELVAASVPAGSLQLDGYLKEPAWQHARPAPLDLPRSLRARGLAIEETGSVRLLHDDRFLYVGFNMVDSELVAQGAEDDLEHYQLGDVAEVFLKPSGQTWYWEFHATPRQRVSTYWFPGRRRPAQSAGSPHLKPPFIKTATHLQGTLNNSEDHDKGWSVEIAVPLSKLDRFGDLRELKKGWTILCARYNYTRYRKQASGPELSSAPALPEPRFHLVHEYAPLIFAP